MTRRTRGQQKGAAKKIHALDTNVLMHDPASLFRFEEHDIYLAAQVLNELDKHKVGMGEAQRNARTASRFMRALLAAHTATGGKLEDGIPLNLLDAGRAASGRLYFEIPKLDPNHPDDRIIASAKALADKVGAIKAPAAKVGSAATKKPTIVLVTKDNLAYVKATAAGLLCEDYLTDAVEEDGFEVETVELEALPSTVSCEKVGKVSHYVVKDDKRLRTGGTMIVPGDKPFRAFVGKRSRGNIELFEVPSYLNGTKVYGINARNEEQNFGLAALMDPAVSAVFLSGPAGTGKNLITIAAGLEQVLESKLYSEIIVTRVTVPMGEDIGFLPGTEEEKMGAWMGAFDDNLEVIVENAADGGDWGKAASMSVLKNNIKIKSLNFMRGRTFVRKFLVIDEGQNLTAKQMKALLTRVGKGSKIVVLGNLAQIDTPYLNENTSGLAYMAERVHTTAPSFIAHIGLVKGERHELTDWVNENC